MNGLPIPGWARQPILWEHEDFKWPAPDSGAVTTAQKPLFDNARWPEQWQIDGNNAVSGSATYLGSIFGHNGVWIIATEPTNGRALWWGNSNGGILSTGIIRPSSVVRWEWWVAIPTITSIAVNFGLDANWTGAPNPSANSSVIILNTTVGSNWTAVTNNSSLTAGPAAVAGAWVKLSAQFREMNFASNTGIIDYYVNEVLFATHAIVPASSLILGGSIVTLTAGIRNCLLDRASLWVDGETMTG